MEYTFVRYALLYTPYNTYIQLILYSLSKTSEYLNHFIELNNLFHGRRPDQSAAALKINMKIAKLSFYIFAVFFETLELKKRWIKTSVSGT